MLRVFKNNAYFINYLWQSIRYQMYWNQRLLILIQLVLMKKKKSNHPVSPHFSHTFLIKNDSCQIMLLLDPFNIRLIYVVFNGTTLYDPVLKTGWQWWISLRKSPGSKKNILLKNRNSSDNIFQFLSRGFATL